MVRPATDPTAEIDPKLEALIEGIVDRKLAEALGDVHTRLDDAFDRLKQVEEEAIAQRVTIVVFSGEFDRLMAAFIIANGAVAMGMEVAMYFTFWGLTALKKETTFAGKSIPEKMVSLMMPTGPGAVGTSRMNFLGMGPLFFKMLMKQNHVETLPDLIAVARELEVKMIACQMSMGVMGIKKEELLDDLEYGGVATYLGDASDSRVTLFI
jgi:peroxiredoxin family protein